MDLGECARIHNWALKADFENAQKERDYYYDIDVSLLSFSVIHVLFKVSR